MIVSAAPRLSKIVRDVWLTLTLLFVWDMIVTIIYFATPLRGPALPLTLFGSVLALFLGVRDSAAYQRWWEGRTLWGGMINSSRSLARAALAFLEGEDEARRELRRTIVLRHLAHVYALKARLRGLDPGPDVRRFVEPAVADMALSRANPPNALLNRTGTAIARAQRSGLLDTIQQSQLEQVLIDISNHQGGMERLKTTPLPNQYRFFPELFTRLFCLLLPIGLVETRGWATPVGSTVAGLMFLAVLRIADDLVDPFANTIHDVPLDAMCRTIEIDLLQSIGDPAPEPLKPVKGVLW